MLLIVSGREFKLLCLCVCFISSYEGDVERKKKEKQDAAHQHKANTRQLAEEAGLTT